MTLPKAIIVEIDGVLADHSHRLGFIYPKYRNDVTEWTNNSQLEVATYYVYSDGSNNYETRKIWKPDYEAFYDAISEDKCNEWCKKILTGLYNEGCAIIFVSDRPEKIRKETEIWLERWCEADFMWESLFMRPDFLTIYRKDDGTYPPLEMKPDHRPAHEVKLEIYDHEINGIYDVLFVLESDPESVKMYRDLGLTCLDVGRK